MKSTKRSLFTSAAALVLSVALLVGTTMAWFTDSVTNSGNKIEAGTLDVQLLESGSDISESTDPVFSYEKWEPGYSTGAVLSVRNNGSLAIKYELELKNVVTSKGIEKVIDVIINDVKVGTLADFMAGQDLDCGVLESDATSTPKNIKLQMQTGASNQYQGATATFDILLKATQATVEEDGFENNLYDSEATYEDGEYSLAPIDKDIAISTSEDTVFADQGFSMIIPQGATENTSVNINVNKTSVPAEVVTEGKTAVAYDISVTDQNGAPVTLTKAAEIELFVGKDLANVVLYHNETIVEDAVYDPSTGYITFSTSSFSPFTTVFDPPREVSDETALKDALAKGITAILKNDIVLSSCIEAKTDIVIKGNGYKLDVAQGVDRVINVSETTQPISITLKNVNMPGPQTGTYTRGISCWQADDVTLVMEDCSLGANYYALNSAFGNKKITAVIRNTTITGWAVMNLHSPYANITFENCTLIGNNDKPYNADGWNGFATFVFDNASGNPDPDGAHDCVITFKNCRIEANSYTGNAQYFMSVRAINTKVVAENCTFYINGEQIPSTIEEIAPHISVRQVALDTFDFELK